MTLQSGTPSGFPSPERGGNGSAGMSASGRSASGPSSPSPGTASGPTTTPSTNPSTAASAYGDTDPGRMYGTSPGSTHRWTRSDDSNRSEFGSFLDDLSELARGGGHSADLRGEIERRVFQARSQMGAALDQGMEMSMRARDQMNRGVAHSREAVSERPLSYLTMAMVGGLLIGMLLSRRD